MGAKSVQAFLWRVPENFTLQSEDEVTDVAPIAKFTGHSRYGWYEEWMLGSTLMLE
jgi:hypothetical protein